MEEALIWFTAMLSWNERLFVRLWESQAKPKGITVFNFHRVFEIMAKPLT